MTKDINEARAKLGTVLYRKTAFDKWAKKNYDKVFRNAGRFMNEYLRIFGEEVVKRAQELIELSPPSGRRYVYVNEQGRKIGSEWNASSAGNAPVSLTGLLKSSITYIVNESEKEVRIGVFSDTEHKYKTIAFWGPDKNSKDFKTVGKIVVGPGGEAHRVKDYAKALEDGTTGKHPVKPRPYLKPAFNQILDELKSQIVKELKKDLEDKLDKKVPVYFRFHAKKQVIKD